MNFLRKTIFSLTLLCGLTTINLFSNNNSIIISTGINNPGYTVISNTNINMTLLSIKLIVDHTSDVTISNITIKASGSGDDLNNIKSASVKLYKDNSDNAIYNGSEIQIGSDQSWSANNGLINFSGINQTLPAGSTNYWLLICSLNGATTPAPDGVSFQAYIENNSAIICDAGITVTGAPLYGGIANVGTDKSPPDIMPATNFANPNPSATTNNIVLIVKAYENAYNGGLIRITTNFSGGSCSDANLRITNGLFLANPLCIAGNPVTDRTSQTSSANNQDRAYVIVNSPVNVEGYLKDWETYINDARGNINLRVWAAGPTNSFTWITDSAVQSPVLGYSKYNLASLISVSNGCYIGFFALDAAPVPKLTTTVEADAAGGNAQWDTADIMTGAFGNVSQELISLKASGYAKATYLSATNDTGRASPDYQKIIWDIQSNGGSNLFQIRAAADVVTLAGATWYNVANNTEPDVLIDNNRYFQYRISLFAATNGLTSPKITDLRIYYNTNLYPRLSVKQLGAPSNYYPVYSSGFNTGPFTYNFDPVAGYDGVAKVYAHTYDQYGNLNTNDYVYIITLDDYVPDLTNIQCWRSAAHAIEIQNSVSNFKEIVSYTWSHTNNVSGVTYYYKLSTVNPIPNEITGIEDSTTNYYFDDQQLYVGTNYFHVRALTGAGHWGQEIIFTNVVYQPSFIIDLGSNSPGNAYILNDESNVVALQIEFAAATRDIIVTNISFRARGFSFGSIDETFDINSGTFRLLVDNNGNGQLDGSDTLIQGNRSINSNNGLVNFTSFSNTIVSNISTNWILVYDLAGYAADDETVIFSLYSNIDIQDTSGAIANGPPLIGATYTIASIGNISIAAGNKNIQSGSIYSNQNNVEMLQMKLTIGPQENIKVSQIQFAGAGTGDELNHIASGSIKIYLDNNADGIYDGEDSLITGGESFTLDNGNVNFNNLNLTLLAGSTTNIILVYNFNGTATNGDNFYASFNNLNNITCKGAKTATTIIPTGSLPIGGTKYVGGDIVPPNFSQGSPFVYPAPCIVTNITIRVSADELVYYGSNFIIESDFANGNVSSPNLDNTGGNLTLTSKKVTVGNAVINRAGNSLNANNAIYTYADNVNTANIEGYLTRWDVYVNSMLVPINLRVWDNGINPFTWISDSASENVLPGTSNSYALNPVIYVSNGYRIGFYSANGGPNPQKATTVESDTGVAGNAYFSTADDTSGSWGGAADNILSIHAEGYAAGTYYSPIFDTGSADPDYYFIYWDEVLNNGTVNVSVRAGDVSNTVANSNWITVENSAIITNSLDNLQFIQYRIQITADDTGSTSPVVDNVKIYYDLDAYPFVEVKQNGTNKIPAIYLSNDSTNTYVFTYTNVSNYDGIAQIYVSGFDGSVNEKTNQMIGTFLIDNTVPIISNLFCWRTTSFLDQVPNDQTYFDDRVSYTWSDPKSVSDDDFYYVYNTNATPCITNTSFSKTGNTNKLNQSMIEGTNYFHVCPRTKAGMWGNELIFTNIYKTSPLTLNQGNNPPADNSIVNDSTNVVMMQLKISCGSNEGVVISNIEFTAIGTGDDNTDITRVILYEDNDNGALNLGTDTPLATNTFTNDNGTIIFTNLNYSINATLVKNWLVVYDFAGSALPGKTFQIEVTTNSNFIAYGQENTSNIIDVTGAPVQGCIKTIAAVGTISLASGTYNPPATNITNNVLNKSMLQIKLTADISENVIITNITLRASGTGDDQLDITANSIRIYDDTNNNGIYEGENQIGSSTSFNSNNGIAVFSGFSFTLKSNTTTNFLVVCHFNGNALDGETFRISLEKNTSIKAYGAGTLRSSGISGAPINGGTMSINGDTTPPFFSPYSGLVSSNPAAQITNLEIYIQADESVKSTNGLTGSTTNYPIVRVVQGTVTNTAKWISGSGQGPFTNIYNVTNIDGLAEVWAEGFDFATPISNWTNMLVGTFLVDTTFPSNFITNYSTFTFITNTNINIAGYVLETNVFITLNTYTSSNGGSLITFSSNKYLGLSSNFVFTNTFISNTDYFTNWIELITFDKASNTYTAPRVGIVFTNLAPTGFPDINITMKSNLATAPYYNGYNLGTNDCVPGSIIEYFIYYTNAGAASAYNVTFTELINTNYAGILSNSIIGTHFDQATYMSGPVPNTAPGLLVDYTIDKVYIIANEIKPFTNGIIRYKVVVR